MSVKCQQRTRFSTIGGPSKACINPYVPRRLRALSCAVSFFMLSVSFGRSVERQLVKLALGRERREPRRARAREGPRGNIEGAPVREPEPCDPPRSKVDSAISIWRQLVRPS